MNAGQVFDVTEAHEGARDLLAALHVGEEIGAAGKWHGGGALAVEDVRGLFEGARGAEVEKGQAHHERVTCSLSGRDFAERGTSFTALPSPP